MQKSKRILINRDHIQTNFIFNFPDCFFSNYTEKIKIELSELVEDLNAGESVVVLPKEIMKEALGGQRHVCLCPPEAKRAILGGK